MAPKRGLSLEDKREKMLEIFHESGDVFMLKDVEKLSCKKGIVLQTVKDVLQSLVDDDMVHQEKIGASNFFWSFIGEASAKIGNDVSKLEAKVAQAKLRKVELQQSIGAEKKGKEDSAERASRLAGLRVLKNEVAEQEAEVAKYKDNDPETFKAMLGAIEASKSSANRWLDNIEALRSWCMKQFQGREDQLAEFFKENGVTDSMEYLE